MDTDTLAIQNAPVSLQREEVVLYVFNHLSPSQILENEQFLAAFRGFVERASDHELSKLSLKKVPRPTPQRININGAVIIISRCLYNLPINIDAQNFWQKQTKVFEDSSAEDSPIIRFRRIHRVLSKVDLEASFYNRVLKVLLLYEYQNVFLEYRKRHNSATANVQIASKEVNAYMTEVLDIEISQLKALRTEAERYLALMFAFGPGILFVLGGTNSAWHKLSNDACIVVELYLRVHLPKVIILAASLNFVVASIIFKGMLLGGTRIDIIELEKTTVGSSIFKFIQVLDDGTLVPKESSDFSFSNYEPEHWEAVEKIHSILPTPQSSREPTPANNRTSTATPEATTAHDTTPTPRELGISFSPPGSQQPGPSLSAFESSGRKRPREFDDELFCDDGGCDNAEDSVSANSHDSSAGSHTEPSNVISSEGQAPSVQHLRVQPNELLDDISIAEILAHISHRNPEFNGLNDEPSLANHRPDLTDIQDDANQTASRKRRGGTGTIQPGRRVKRGTASGTAASTHHSSADPQTDPNSTVQASLAESEGSPDFSVNTGGDAVSVNESTSEVDSSSDTPYPEVTSLIDNSTSAGTHAGSDSNLQIQPVSHEPPIEQAASLLFDFQNSQPAPSFPTHRVSNVEVQFQSSAGGPTSEALCLPSSATLTPSFTSGLWGDARRVEQAYKRNLDPYMRIPPTDQASEHLYNSTVQMQPSQLSFDPSNYMQIPSIDQGSEHLSQLSFDPSNYMLSFDPSNYMQIPPTDQASEHLYNSTVQMEPSQLSFDPSNFMQIPPTDQASEHLYSSTVQMQPQRSLDPSNYMQIPPTSLSMKQIFSEHLYNSRPSMESTFNPLTEHWGNGHLDQLLIHDTETQAGSSSSTPFQMQILCT